VRVKKTRINANKKNWVKNSNRQKTGSTFLAGIKKAGIIADNRFF
jgi:hypothetical protein